MRRILGVLLMLWMACVLSSAAAEPEGPVNPDRQTVLDHSQITDTEAERAYSLYTRMALLAAGADDTAEPTSVDFSVYKDAALSYTRGGTWRVQVNQSGNWRYEFFLGESSSVFGASWVIHRQKTSTNNTYTSCPAVAPGTYRTLLVL